MRAQQHPRETLHASLPVGHGLTLVSQGSRPASCPALTRQYSPRGRGVQTRRVTDTAQPGTTQCWLERDYHWMLPEHLPSFTLPTSKPVTQHSSELADISVSQRPGKRQTLDASTKEPFCSWVRAWVEGSCTAVGLWQFCLQNRGLRMDGL